MLDRSVAPPFVKSSSFDLITPEEAQLSNGVHVYFVPGGSQDVLKIEFVFDAGRWFETKVAAAYFTAQLLSKGTPDKTSFDIAQIFDRYGAHLEINPGLDFASVALYALSKNLEPVLQLLMEILSTPAFPEKEFIQTRDIFLQNLKINNEKTSFVASQEFRKKLFGEEHPYGVEVEEKTAKAVAIKDLEKHFASFMHSPKVFISGKIEPANRELMLKKFQLLRPGAKAEKDKPETSRITGYRHIAKKESVQSSVRMGKPTVLRAHPDYVPLLFVSHILGGYFGSRLMKNIREEKGLTYGISASIHALRHESYLVIGADVNKENVDLTFDEIAREIKILCTHPISGDELETTRNHFIGSLQSEITTPFAHADKIKTIKLFGLEADYYQKMISRIDAMTPSIIIDTSKRYFQDDSFTRIAVG
ncbi:MAG TPA: pitrilysin family protein [Chryseosolibacter sp.]|nr:pitrilysin family protein [Chryseosolibacter sp.]